MGKVLVYIHLTFPAPFVIIFRRSCFAVLPLSRELNFGLNALTGFFISRLGKRRGADNTMNGEQPCKKD